MSSVLSSLASALFRKEPCNRQQDGNPLNPCKSKVKQAYKVYLEHLYYHGTHAKSAENIYQHGFDKAHKREGCTHLLTQSFGLSDPAAKTHHYVMGHVSAARYAKMHKDPVIVRVIIPNNIRLECDPEGFADDERRTSQDILPHLILPALPAQLGKEQVKRINQDLDIKLSDSKVEKLIKMLSKKIIKKSKKDAKLLQTVVDFKHAEQMRNEKTLLMLKNAGIRDLKPGDTFSIALDD